MSVKMRMVRGYIDGAPVFSKEPFEVSENAAAALLKRRKFSRISFLAAQEEGRAYNGKYILESDFQAEFAQKAKSEPTAEIDESEGPAKRGRKPKND